MNVYFPSKYEISDEYSLHTLKYNSDKIERTIKELQELQQIITNRAMTVALLNSSYKITILRSDRTPPVKYDVEVYQIFENDKYECKRVFHEHKFFGASREDKEALKQYVAAMENKYNVKCKADYKKLKL